MRKMSMLFLVAVLLLSMMLGVRDASAADNKVYNLKLAAAVAADNPYCLSAYRMAEYLEEKSNGRIKADVFPGGQLGSERELVESLQLGSLDFSFTASAVLANFSGQFYAWDLPYIFRDRAHAYKVLDGPIGQEVKDSVLNKGLIVLEFLESGWMDIHACDKPILVPEDAKGLKFRAVENKVHMAFFSALGATPVPAPYGEIYTVLQNRTVDGTANTLAVIYTQKHYEVAPNITDQHYMYIPACLTMSKATMDSLPPDLQKLVLEAAVIARDYERKLIADMEGEAIKNMRAAGARYDEVDKEVWKNAVQSLYTQFVPSLVDSELVQRIQDVE